MFLKTDCAHRVLVTMACLFRDGMSKRGAGTKTSMVKETEWTTHKHTLMIAEAHMISQVRSVLRDVYRKAYLGLSRSMHTHPELP